MSFDTDLDFWAYQSSAGRGLVRDGRARLQLANSGFISANHLKVNRSIRSLPLAVL